MHASETGVEKRVDVGHTSATEVPLFSYAANHVSYYRYVSEGQTKTKGTGTYLKLNMWVDFVESPS